MISITCPACGTPRQCPDHLAGWEVECRDCRTPVRVESRATLAAGPPAAAHFGRANGLVRFSLGVVGGLLALGLLTGFVAAMFFGRMILEGFAGYHPAWKSTHIWMGLGGSVLGALVCLGGLHLVGAVGSHIRGAEQPVTR